MPIPQFKLNRWAEIELQNEKLTVNGVDKNGGPYTLFKNVKANFDKKSELYKIELTF